MAIKAGQILHVANQFVIDRIQTGGAGNLNIPQEKVYELGNYQTVGIVRDVPDLSFNLDCIEVGTEVEALMVGRTNPHADARGVEADPDAVDGNGDPAPVTAVVGARYNLADIKPIDITSPWKAPFGEFGSVRGVVIPNLTLESASYRYGLQENAGEQYSLRGDAIYYTPGHPWQDIKAGDGTTAAFTFDHGPALVYREGGETFYALSVMVDGERQTDGVDYTDAPTGVTFLDGHIPASGARISVVYASAADATYPQLGVTPYGSGDANLVHQGVAIKPAAIRGKNIDVFFSTLVGGNPVEVKWPDVQSVNIDWRVTIEDDYEFGNPRAVVRDFADVPEVTGSVELRPRSVEAFFTRLRQITGVADGEVIGPQSSVAGALRVVLKNPDSGGSTLVPPGTVLKTHYIPDARFTMPGYEGRVQQKYNATLNFESDGGVLETYKGARVVA